MLPEQTFFNADEHRQMTEIIADHNFHHRQLLRRECCGASAEPGQCDADHESCNCRALRRCHRYSSLNKLISLTTVNQAGLRKTFTQYLLEVLRYTPSRPEADRAIHSKRGIVPRKLLFRCREDFLFDVSDISRASRGGHVALSLPRTA